VTDSTSLGGQQLPPAARTGFEPAPGGHVVPARLSGGAPSAVRARKKHTGAILGSLGAVAAIAAVIVVQVIANVGYDDAEAAYADSAATAATLRSDLSAELDALRSTTESATLIVQSDSGLLLDVGSLDALAAAAAESETTASDADELVSVTLPGAGEKPFWFWQLFGAAQQIDGYRADAEEHAADLQDGAEGVAAEASELTDAGVAALTAAAGAAAPFEAAHINARNLDVIALRDAAEEAAAATALDAYAADVFSSLNAAATQVIASEQAELAEKAGPLQGARLGVEAFARSLAPGVLLDFDWAPLVNGFGYDGGMGGYATWWYGEPGYATIQLSNSVAEQWPAARSQALVAHEVGHAISVKCADMYDSSTQESIENWATAWAISMGFTDDANGVWAYGYPPQSYIDAAAACR